MSRSKGPVVVAVVALVALAGWLAAARVFRSEDRGNFAEWAAAVGTVGALVYAGLQLRNESEALKASDEQRRVDQQDSRRQLELLREQAELLREQAEIARGALLAAARPLLVSAGKRARLNARAGECTVTLRNIGEGPAFIVTAGAAVKGASWHGDFAPSAVEPKAEVHVSVKLPPDREDLEPLRRSWLTQTASVFVEYTDASGQDKLRSRADVHTWDGEPRIRQVFVFEEAEAEPFLATGPVDLVGHEERPGPDH